MSRKAKQVLVYIVLIIITLAVIFPIYWTFLVSSKPTIDLLGKPVPYPGKFHIKNYTHPFIEGLYGKYMLNSTIIASGNVLLVLATSIPATYALSRFKIKGRDNLFFWFLNNRMAPPAIFMIPLYLIFSGSVIGFIKLMDTHLALILVHCLFNIPFAIWQMKGAIDNLPIELDESAFMDGCSRLRILWQIVIPITKPTIAVTAILVWLFSWNELLLASILTSTRASPITPGVIQFVTMAGIDWGEMAAVTIASFLPAFIFIAFVQKHIITGLSLGAIKE